LKRLFALSFIAILLLAVSVYRAKLGASKSETAIAELETRLVDLREEVSVLRNELKHLSREKRLDEIASEELGMGPIRPEQIVSPSELAARMAAADTQSDGNAEGGQQ
tara:strand:- start:119 stop:442 length:324 start_codon:yes stop_codon:yes gene_type:complete